jgi:Zn-dependent protease
METKSMKWSALLGRFAGIDVYVHATFFLLLGWFTWIYWVQTGTFAGVLTGLTLIILLFGCVLLHEYGHALTARRYGIETRNITLLPIGGLALLERMPTDPRQEIVVALAGPAVNVVIAIFLYLILAVSGSSHLLTSVGLGQGGVLPSLLAANIMLVLFNLLPAFPMDGGRVLRAALSMRTDRVRATRMAAQIGQTLAVGLGILGLMGNPFLILIAVFVWIGAAAEATSVEINDRLAGQPAGRAMMTDFLSLSPDDNLSRAVDLTLAGTQKDFPVLRDGRAEGVLTQNALFTGLRTLGEDASVESVMTDVHIVEITRPLDGLLEELQGSGARLVCVTDGQRLVGIVDLENITEYLRIQAALSGR